MTTYTTQKISARTDAGAITGDEIFPVVRPDDTGDYRTTVDAVVTYLLTNPDILTLLEDRFGVHILEAFDAILGDVTADDLQVQAVSQRNTGDTSQWITEVDPDGNFVIDHDTGTEGALVLNGGGDVTLGLSTFRTQIVTRSADYTLLGNEDKARHVRATKSGSSQAITIQQDSAVSDPTTDLFFTNDWLLLERATSQAVTLTQGTGVTITNAHTGATGSLAITHKGGVALIRRTGANAYSVWGDIPQATSYPVITLTSSGGAATMDWTLGDVFAITLTENTTITHANLSTDCAQNKQLFVTQDSDTAKTLDFAGTSRWPSGGEYAATTDLSSTDELSLTNRGDGATVYYKYTNNFAVAS